ncbi:hypothetical protein [Sulfitobacter faviae]|uniref:hypothetical protein n=1 Tax=Sulfitobacter faviae TaxID=1775881 RepID=UPI00398CD0DE
MPDPTFDVPPPAPSRKSPGTFSDRLDPFLAWMVSFRDELVAAVSWMSAAVTSVGNDKTAAGNSATAAAASAAAAAAYVDAEAHVPSAAYVVNDAVISNVNHQTYRCITAHSGVTTDPSADATNWVLISFDGDYDSLRDKPTLGTVADKDTGTDEGDIPILGAEGKLPLGVMPISGSLLAVVQDQKAAGTSGGGANSGWNTRILNTIAHDPYSLVAVSTNTFTVSRDCVATWRAPFRGKPATVATRLVRTTDDATVGNGTHAEIGTSDNVSLNLDTEAESSGFAILEAGETYRLEYYKSGSTVSLGESVVGSGIPAIYAQVFLWS